MFGEIDYPLNASRGLSAIAEFIVEIKRLKGRFLQSSDSNSAYS